MTLTSGSQPTGPLTVVIPAYNEEGCVREVLESWLKKLRSLQDKRAFEAFRIVVVNDGSKDRTGQILDETGAANPELMVVHKPNGGHGTALFEGYRTALSLNPSWVFQVDSDNQFIPDDFEKLWERRGESLFVLGRRLTRHDPLHRLVITRILKAFNFLLFGTAISDVNIPYRLISGPYLRILLDNIPPNVFAPNIFLAVLAAKDGQRLIGVPVEHLSRTTGKISIVRLRLIKACLRCVRELWDFRVSLSRTASSVRAGREQRA